MKPIFFLLALFSINFPQIVFAQTNEELRDSILFFTSKENPDILKKYTFQELEGFNISAIKCIDLGYKRVIENKVDDAIIKAFFLFKKAIHFREQQQELDLATTLMQNALELMQSDKSNIQKDPFLYGQILTRLGYIEYYNNYDFQKAEQYYLEALDKYLIKDSVYTYSTVLLNLTHLYRDKNNFAKAKEYAQKVIALRKAYGENNYYYINSLNNLATLYEYFEQYDIAEEYYLEAKRCVSLNKIAFYQQDIEILNNLGVLYMNVGRYDEAENYIQQVMQADLKAPNGINSIDYAMSCHNLALVYYYKKDFSKAKHYLDICLNIERKFYGENSPNYARSLRSLADLYILQEKFSEALKVYNSIIKIYEQNIQNRENISKEYLSILKGLAILYDKWKIYPKSLEYYEKVVQLQDKMETKGLSLYLNSIVNLSKAHAKNNNFQKAEELIQEAIKLNALGKTKDSIIVENLDKEQWIYPRIATLALSTYAENIALKNKYNKTTNKEINKAYALIKQAIQINKKHRTEFWSEKDKLSLLEINYNYTSIALNIAQQTDNLSLNKDAYFLIENNKAALLSEGIKTQQAHKFLPKQLAEKENELTWKYSLALRSLSDAESQEEYIYIQEKIGILQKEIHDLKIQLESKFPKYYQLKYGNYIADFEKIQAKLKGNELLIQYFVAQDYTYILAISNNDSKLFYSPITDYILRDSVDKMKKYLTDFEYIRYNAQKAYDGYTKLAHWLYIGLLKNTLEYFPEKNELIIIPDSHLGLIPFEIFLKKPAIDTEINYKNLSYLIRDYPIVYHYSASLWADYSPQIKESVFNNGKILAMGGSYTNTANPALERSQQIQALRKSLKPLSAVKIELEAIQKIYKGDFVLDNNSTEAYFKENAPQQDMIHLAMHAMGNKNNPMLSSLFFTESNDIQEDNILEAWEIMQLPLSARLVVLSACESGVGVYLRGDGVSSLARSFMYAGANSLLVSLWKVNDQSTAAIMQNYYYNLAKNLNKSKALQLAKLEYLDTYKGDVLHPAYWAAFIQIGDNQPIKPKDNNIILYVSAIGLFILIGSFWAYKKYKRQVA